MSRHPASNDVFQAIADPTRRGILDLLGAGEQPVGHLARQFDMTLSAVSQHIRVLREVGLVAVRRVGRERLYRLKADPLKEVSDWVQHYERFWQGKLDALGEHLERNP
jgi:DNA-binding transcriptional ArsR family regulator